MKGIRLFFVLLLLGNTAQAQQANYIKNGSFEFGPASKKQSEADNLNHWHDRDDVDENDTIFPYFHSPDSYREGVPWTEPYLEGPPPTYNDGRTVVGMHEYEILQQQLVNKLEERRQYVVSMNIRLEQNWKDSRPCRLNVYMARKEVEYQEESDRDKICSDDYVTHKDGLSQQIKLVASWPLDTVTYTRTQWHRIQRGFFAETTHPIFGWDDLDWFAIELVYDAHDNSMSGTPDCNGNYLWIDNVRLEYADFCESVCAPDLDPIIVNPPPNNFINAMATGVDTSQQPFLVPFVFQVENATGITFRVFNTWTGWEPMYERTAFDPNGLVDVGYTDYQFLWSGLIDGQKLPEDVYFYDVTIWNCEQSITIGRNWFAYLVIDDPTLNDPPEIMTYDLNDCCPQISIYENTTINGDDREDVHDYISSGNSVVNPGGGSVVIGPNADVVWYAGNNIFLGSNTSFDPGAEVLMEIKDCIYGDKLPKSNARTRLKLKGERMTLPPDFDVSDIDRDVTLAPNPSNTGNVSISLRGFNSKTPVQVQIVNVLGSIVYDKEHSVRHELNLDISTLDRGTYFVLLIDGKQRYIEKLIVQ